MRAESSNGTSRRKVRGNAGRFQDARPQPGQVSNKVQETGRNEAVKTSQERGWRRAFRVTAGESGSLRRGAERNRAEPLSGGEIDNEELSAAVGQQQIDDEPIGSGGHCLDPGLRGQIDRLRDKARLCCGLRGFVRDPRGYGTDQHDGSDDQHHPHDDDRDLQHAHRTELNWQER